MFGIKSNAKWVDAIGIIISLLIGFAIGWFTKKLTSKKNNDKKQEDNQLL